MNVCKYILVVFNIFIIRVISILWLPIIFNYRNTAREVVYSYFSNNDMHAMKYDTIWTSVYYGLCNSKYDNSRYEYIRFLWWYYVVWIWVNDRLRDDYFDVEVYKHLNNEKWFDKKLIDLFNKYKRDKSKAKLIGWLVNIVLPDNNYEFANCIIYTKDKLWYKKILDMEFGYKLVSEYNGKKEYHMYFIKGIINIKDIH